MSPSLGATDELGDRCYLADQAQGAAVMDPQRDVDRVGTVLTDVGLDCKLVLGEQYPQ